MKPNELRIGNFLKWNNEHDVFISVAGITNDKEDGYIIQYKELESKLENIIQLDSFEPIPLTEEWLEKLGFKSISSYWKLEDELIHLHVYLYTNIRPYVELYAGEYVDGESAVIPILYLHQLQNIWFALIGEELEIKKVA